MTTAPDYLESAARDLDKGTVSLDAYAVARIETGAGT
jgi:hypothetical protein